jgi:hypothetical protein
VLVVVEAVVVDVVVVGARAVRPQFLGVVVVAVGLVAVRCLGIFSSILSRRRPTGSRLA